VEVFIVIRKPASDHNPWQFVIKFPETRLSRHRVLPTFVPNPFSRRQRDWQFRISGPYNDAKAARIMNDLHSSKFDTPKSNVLLDLGIGLAAAADSYVKAKCGD
jgi:hypothetical protein